MSSQPSTSKQSEVQNLAEIFKCFICIEKVRNAYMCPHCSKLCCYSCIRRWLTETRHECPHCRATLYLNDLVNCRWAEEVTQHIDCLQSKQASISNTESSLIDSSCIIQRCDVHPKEELSVYCLTCCCCICHQCALFSASHAGHSFKQMEAIYEQHCREIQEVVQEGKIKLKALLATITDVEKNIENVRSSKDARVREIRNAVELIIARLDANLKTKLMTLVNQKGHLTRQVEELESTLVNIELKLASGPKNEVIVGCNKIIDDLKNLFVKSTISIAPVPVEFISELVPSYTGGYFDVQGFSRLRIKADPFYSDPIMVNGLTWRLKIYPDGNGVVRGVFLSVFLELTDGPTEPSKYEYRIQMIHRDPAKTLVREFASDFETGECWGYNRYYKLDLLETEKFLDEKDTITFQFEVRPPTYYQQSKDLLWYTEKLKFNSRSQPSRETVLLELHKPASSVGHSREHSRATWNKPSIPPVLALSRSSAKCIPTQFTIARGQSIPEANSVIYFEPAAFVVDDDHEYGEENGGSGNNGDESSLDERDIESFGDGEDAESANNTERINGGETQNCNPRGNRFGLESDCIIIDD